MSKNKETEMPLLSTEQNNSGRLVREKFNGVVLIERTEQIIKE